MYEKILVCLDGSEIAEKIIPFAGDEALAHNSEVILLRVVPLPANLTLGVPGFPSVAFHTGSMPEQLKEELDEARRYLQSVSETLRKQGVKVDSEALLGSPGPGIISYANEKKVDLIAMASHGHSGLRNVLLGSVAEHVVRESGLPILLIKPR